MKIPLRALSIAMHGIAPVCTLLLALPQFGCPPVQTGGQVSGVIDVHGYDIDPNDIMIRARPLNIPVDDGETKARPVIGRATRLPGGEQFEFTLSGLEEDIPYRIGLRIDNQDTKLYPRLVWNSNKDPLVIASDTSLEFHAYAVRSEIEVMTADVGRDRPEWVGADVLDFTVPDQAARTFRWRTSLTNVTGGRLQVSVAPFPRIAERGYNPCANDDDGIVYTVDFEAIPGEWVTLPPVNFHALLAGGRDDPRDKAALAGSIGKALDSPSWETDTLPKLEAGMPLYVRVLPLVGDVSVCDPDDGGVPPEVILARLLLEVFEGIEVIENPKVQIGTVWYNKPVIGARPYAGETCYRFTQDHKLRSPFGGGGTAWDMLAKAYTSGASYNQTILAGTSFCVPPDDDDDGWFESFAESFSSVITGAFDALADAVNYVSNLWEEIQDAVVDVVAGAIDDIGIINCGPNSACRKALEAGLELALASMGVPPSLPNFEELVDEGIDYVAAQVASQVGVPPELVDYASQQAKDFVKKVAEDMQANYHVPGLPDWLAPDLRFQPASVVMELYGPGTDEPFNSQPMIIRNNSPIFLGAGVKLPIALPKQGEEPPIMFPMVLPPNTEGLDPAPTFTIPTLTGPVTLYPSEYGKGVWYKNQWITHRYAYPFSCYSFYLVALSSPGGIYNLRDNHFVPYDSTIGCE